MVSVIVSSYKPEYFIQFERSLANTIGAAYEIIKINNPGLMGICEAYNKGAVKAKFSYLCFVHEDVSFKSQNWAKPLIEQYEQHPDTGVIGIAGSTYKCQAPSGWNTFLEGVDYLHIIQRAKRKEDEFTRHSSVPFQKVDCLDGVFLFTTKKLWEKIRFDKDTFGHYHCYDIDFSFAVSLVAQNYVTNHVLIEHFSLGSYDENWVRDTLLFHHKWKQHLPKGSVHPYSFQKKLEWNKKFVFLHQMIDNGYSFSELMQVYLHYGFACFFSFYRAASTFRSVIIAYRKKGKTKAGA